MIIGILFSWATTQVILTLLWPASLKVQRTDRGVNRGLTESVLPSTTPVVEFGSVKSYQESLQLKGTMKDTPLGFQRSGGQPKVPERTSRNPKEDISDLAALFFPGAHHDFDIGGIS